jgi:hypothetical protein
MDTSEQNSTLQENQAEELSHTDKMTGIFTEPSATFENISKFPVRTVDWILPVIILFIVVSLTQILVMSNEEIYFEARQKQREQMQKTFNEMVQKGQLTREQADRQLEAVEERMAMGRGPAGFIFQAAGIFVVGFIVFFLVALIYFLLSKFALGGNGGYTSALVASGLTAYISIIQIVLGAILAMAFGRLINDVSVASFANIDKSTITGWFLGKVDPFSIWAYSITSIGLAKMFRSDSVTKYFIVVFAVWILGFYSGQSEKQFRSWDFYLQCKI